MSKYNIFILNIISKYSACPIQSKVETIPILDFEKKIIITTRYSHYSTNLQENI